MPEPPEVQVVYEDLAARLIGNTWLALTYAILCIVVLYALHLWADTTVLFAAAQLPTLVLTTLVIRNNKRLLLRVPFTWIVTALLVWAVYQSSRGTGAAPNGLAAIAVCLLAGYWLIRSLLGSIRECRTSEEGTPAAIALLISAWGATLQVCTLSLAVIGPILSPILKATLTGEQLIVVLSLVRWTSPLHWFPMGILLTGLTLQAALLFKQVPYVPKDFDDVLAGEVPMIIAPIIAALRLPMWLSIVMAGFLVHFVQLLWECSREFFEEWIGRFVLMLLGLLLPTALLVAAHSVVLAAMSFIANYLATGATTPGSIALTMIAVHGLALAGLCLYITVPLPMALEIVPIRLKEVPELVLLFWECEGKPAANSVGRTYSIFGSLVLAIPLSGLLPGGSSIGAFSIFYILLIGFALIVYFRSGRRKA